MPARVLPHDELAVLDADILGRHDFVGRLLLDDAVLVYPCLVGESVSPDDRLVRLDYQPGQVGQQPARRVDFPGVHTTIQPEQVFAGVERHHYLLERRVARPLADPVDGAFDLTHAVLHCDQRVGNSQPEVVMAMNGQYGLADVRNVRPDIVDALTELRWDRVPYRVRDV